MFALIRFETRKAVSQNKCLLAFFAIVLINALFVVGFFMTKNDPKKLTKLLGADLMQEFFNACVYVQAILSPCALILFPVLIAVIVAYVFSGEIEIGHMRLTMVRPLSRTKILFAKWAAVAFYSAFLLLALMATAYLCACVFMKPNGDLIVIGDLFGIKQKFVVHPAGFEAWSRIALSYLLAWPMLLSIASMAFMFSAFSRNFALSAILSSTVYLASYLVGELPFLSGIHKFLPTRYMPFWKYALSTEIPWDKLAVDAAWTFAFSAAFMALAAVFYERCDF